MKKSRKNPHLTAYDYSQPGAYLVTLATRNRSCLFGGLSDGALILNDAASMLERQWAALRHRYPHLQMDFCQAMPDHFHGILFILRESSPAVSLLEIVNYFKSVTTRAYIRGVSSAGWRRFSKKLWQPGFHEHVIRDASDLGAFRAYIENNPRQWVLDRSYLVPENFRRGGGKGKGPLEP